MSLITAQQARQRSIQQSSTFANKKIITAINNAIDQGRSQVTITQPGTNDDEIQYLRNFGYDVKYQKLLMYRNLYGHDYDRRRSRGSQSR